MRYCAVISTGSIPRQRTAVKLAAGADAQRMEHMRWIGPRERWPRSMEEVHLRGRLQRKAIGGSGWRRRSIRAWLPNQRPATQLRTSAQLTAELPDAKAQCVATSDQAQTGARPGYMRDCISDMEVRATTEQAEAVDVLASRLVSDHGCVPAQMQTHPRVRVRGEIGRCAWLAPGGYRSIQIRGARQG